MAPPPHSTGFSSLLKYLSWSLYLAWTLLVGGLLTWDLLHWQREAQKLAVTEAVTLLNQDHAIRLWAASHKGIYVPVDEDTRPNPALAALDARDGVTTGGQPLTLLHPASVIAELHGRYARLYGITSKQVHLQSLAATDRESPAGLDEWERSALTAFARGDTQPRSQIVPGGEPFLRYIQPVYADPECIVCHSDYQAGDVLAGVHIQIPLQPLLERNRPGLLNLRISLGIVWAFGLLGIRFWTLSLTHQIDQREQAELNLRVSEAHYRDMLENAYDMVQSVGPGGKLIYVNRRWTELMGYSLEEATDLDFSQIIHPDHLDHCRAIFANLQQQTDAARIETVFLTKTGKELVVEGNISAQRLQGNLTATRGIFRDISERKAYEDHLQHLATHDPLTQLPNRSLFVDRLMGSIAHARRSERLVAVLFLDLDGFKQVNDRLGHEQGDILLKLLAGRLQANLRESDTVSRLGGDEFAILADNLETPADAARIAAKLLTVIAGPYLLEGGEALVTGSIGICLYPLDGQLAVDLLQKADAAMYQAKQSGKNTFQFCRR